MVWLGFEPGAAQLVFLSFFLFDFIILSTFKSVDRISGDFYDEIHIVWSVHYEESTFPTFN